jgi:leucyl aminopeptidase
MKKLQKMGAGAFVAVGQGSEPQDAAIVHLTYSPKGAEKHIALVGKGICFDTGGHNLKPAKYMNGMHEDMNGSAVALGILLAATQSKLPIKIDCWLAIAQNHIGPKAYKQNDVVTALNGTTIEIVHTDAEGRMVLADTLTLASRAKPEFILDFATLTGSMATALGDRYSGILGNRPDLLCKAIGAGAAAGERVNAFPFDEDYDEDLDSGIADIKQCTLDGGADHVLATRFLSKFMESDIPWVHVDLSSSNRKGGLGAVASDVNGFGVGFGLELLNRLREEI